MGIWEWLQAQDQSLTQFQQDPVGQTVPGVEQLLEDVFSSVGGGAPGAAAAPPTGGTGGYTSGRRPRGVPDAPPTPEELAKSATILKGFGFNDAQVEWYFSQPPEVQDEIDAKLISSIEAPKAEKPPPDRARLEAAYADDPEALSLIEGTSDEYLPSIISTLASRKLRAPTAAEKPGAYQISRSAAASQLGVSEQDLAGMTDAAVSDAVQEAFEASRTGEQQYEDAPGNVGLRIVQDQAFERSGLKSGDTVCVRIP